MTVWADMHITELDNPFGKNTQPTSKRLGNADFTLVNMNLGRRLETSMRIDAAVMWPVLGDMFHQLMPFLGRSE